MPKQKSVPSVPTICDSEVASISSRSQSGRWILLKPAGTGTGTGTETETGTRTETGKYES